MPSIQILIQILIGLWEGHDNYVGGKGLQRVLSV